MTNKEVLKELKLCYEYLNDILDNCELLCEEERETLASTRETLDLLYGKAYKNLKPQKAVHCPHCKKEMYISDLIGYAYVCFSCDENMYLCEGDTNYAWWFDDEKDIDCQLEDIIDKKIKQLENELRYVKSRNEVCGTSKRDLAEEYSIEEEIEYYKDILSNM